MAIATIVRDGCTPVPRRKPSATHPRIVSSATYRMLSQWMNPETNVIALPAENGMMGRSPSVTATIASVASANERSLRVFTRTLTSQPARPTRPMTASAPWSFGQLR